MRTARALTVSPSMLCGGGGSALGGRGGVSALGVSAPRGVSALGSKVGCVCSWGVSAPGGVCSSGGGIPACTESDPSPVNRITDACRNITLPQTSFAGGNNTSASDRERLASLSVRGTFFYHNKVLKNVSGIFKRTSHSFKRGEFLILFAEAVRT